MLDSASTYAPMVRGTLGSWLWRLIMFPAAQIVVAISSWVSIFTACVLLSRHEIDYAMLLAVVATLLRVFPPWHRRLVFAFDPFLAIVAAWGMFVNADRADSDAAVFGYRIAGIVGIVLQVGWSLFRDWCRFRNPFTGASE